MEEEEEEELLSEKNDLNAYFRQFNSDLNIRTEGSLQEPIQNVNSSTVDERECIDSDIADEVNIILLSRLIFDEDRYVVEELFSRYKVVKTNLLKNMFKGSFSILFMFLGLYFYYAIGALVLLFVSIYYSYKAADCLWKNHYKKKQLERLTNTIKLNYKALKKTMKFIIENEIVLKSCLAEFNRHQDELDTNKSIRFEIFNSRLKSFNNLRKEFINTAIKCTKIYIKYTNDLGKMFPLLYDFMNEVQFCRDSVLADIGIDVNYVKLHHTYMLTQSEFLQRLIYCLIPNIQTSPNEEATKELRKLILKMSNEFEVLTDQLNKKFKYVFLHGIHTGYRSPLLRKEDGSDTKLDKKKIQLCENIHDVSNTLQTLLITSRTLENYIENNVANSLFIEETLTNLKSDLKSCQNEVEESFIFLKRLNGIDNDGFTGYSNEEAQLENTCEDIHKIQVGYTDLDPKVDDEIFEAYFAYGTEKKDAYEEFITDEERNRKKLEKEYSKHVLKELKTKLVVKAKEWEAREAKILKKDLLEESINKKNSGIISDTNWPLPCFKRCQKPSRKKNKQKDAIKNKTYESTDKDLPSGEREDTDTSENVFTKPIQANLLSQCILQAREGLLNGNTLTEETFCASGENSEEEM